MSRRYSNNTFVTFIIDESIMLDNNAIKTKLTVLSVSVPEEA